MAPIGVWRQSISSKRALNKYLLTYRFGPPR
jgi:hypothetical protein